jgi:acyl-coenzyme A synthetase/AMP-(fatty) acid ligase
MPNNSNPNNLADELTNQASSRPEAIAVRLRASDVSFRQLEILTWRAATFLHRSGARAGDVVGLSFANELTSIVTMLATARIGATTFSVPAGSPPILQAQMLEEAKARILATDIADPHAGGLPRLLVNMGFLAKDSTPIDTSVRDKYPQAPWLIISGSGSTGRPKQIPVTHSVFRERMVLYSDRISTSPSDCVVSLIHTDFPSTKNQYLNALFAGASICLFDRAHTNPIELCRHTRATILYTAVLHLAQLIDRLPPESRDVLGSLRALVPAGSVVSDGLRQRVLEKLSRNLYVRYGTTETGPITDATPQEVPFVSGTVGRPLSGVQVEIVDANDKKLPPGEAGRIRIRSPGMIHCYLNDEVATDRAFKDGWFLPGDIGKFTVDGQLVFLGRADHMMIMDGINIYPAEIEAVVGRHPAVRDSAAIPLRSPLHQDIPVCAVALHSGKVASETELLEFTFQRLGSRYPRRIILLEEIPRTKQGKLLLNELSQEIADKLRRPA